VFIVLKWLYSCLIPNLPVFIFMLMYSYCFFIHFYCYVCVVFSFTVLFCVLCVCVCVCVCKCVLYYCHRVSKQLQLTKYISIFSPGLSLWELGHQSYLFSVSMTLLFRGQEVNQNLIIDCFSLIGYCKILKIY